MADAETTATTGTRADTREDVLAILRANEAAIRNFGATALFLYGSAARDELTSSSDVDVFVDYEPDGPFGFVELFDLKYMLEDLLLRKVDLGTRKGLHHLLKSRIEKSSVRVF
jgi:uncharacterized protein